MSEPHVITREMLVSTLSDVMKERDAAKREAEQYRDDYSKTLTNNTSLRNQVERLESNSKLAFEQLDVLRASNERLQKQACTCALGPIQTRSPDENTRIKELNQIVQSLQTNFIEMRGQRDQLSKALDAADIQLKHERNARGEVTKERDGLNKAIVMLEQQLKIRTTERDSLHKQQCQCVPVLEERIAKLKSQLPAEMQECTIRFIECEQGHGRLVADNWTKARCPWCTIGKLRVLFDEGMHSTEMLLSNPPKNVIAYRGREILREGE